LKGRGKKKKKKTLGGSSRHTQNLQDLGKNDISEGQKKGRPLE